MRHPLARAAAVAAFLLGPACAQAQDFGRLDFFRVEGLPPGDTLSIREAPDADSPAIGQAPPRGRLRGFGCTNDTPSGLTWCRVKLGPIVGWARRRYLTPE
ncbi:SH3 domain-containing protein [Methylobacterium sp. 17Sr1-1]|uniref:SH3 domain-containing protein n=1 Tax=Methylobacterium sp. 17Sr1-1 TaxID=2202826 RepID=UPI000D6EE51F|nr:SH3 domain-containing protein [Methylobacterium sp. 17Sr1-1]AWN51219.1 peptide-binding protein [Methylobacterium sp. 17Sr1-1]